MYAAQLRDFDLMTMKPSDTEFSQDFTLTVTKDSKMTCFVGYFDTFFDLPAASYFSTGPHAPPTHWKQTIFYLPQYRQVIKGNVRESGYFWGVVQKFK